MTPQPTTHQQRINRLAADAIDRVGALEGQVADLTAQLADVTARLAAVEKVIDALPPGLPRGPR